MTDTLLLSRRDVAELLPIRDCIEAVEGAFRAAAEDSIPSAVLGLHAPNGGFHIKAAGLRRGRFYVAAKINANFPDNPARGLPTIQGLVAVCDAEDGQLLAAMDSMEVTALRTAAATGVAARLLARAEASTVALCGCGAQGGHQVRALAAVRPVTSVRVHDRDDARAAAFATRLSDETHIPVSVAQDWPAAARGADMIVTCTTSTSPILRQGGVRPGAFIAAVGADSPAKQEIEPALLATSRVFVDSLEQAAAMGDLHHAIAAGLMTAGDVQAELSAVVSGRERGRGSETEIIVFDSTGVALEDVAAAALVYERAVAAGRGQRFDFASEG
jgi:alanine dehydrogenase